MRRTLFTFLALAVFMAAGCQGPRAVDTPTELVPPPIEDPCPDGT